MLHAETFSCSSKNLPAGIAVKYGLSDRTLQKIYVVFKQYPQIEKAILYSSRAIGTYRNGSDIDLTLHSALVLTHFGIFTINPRHERIRTG